MNRVSILLFLSTICLIPTLAAADPSGIDPNDFVVPHTGTFCMEVRGYDSNATWPNTAFFNRVDIPPPPPNDTCGGAIEIPGCSSGTINGTMDGARNDYDPGVPGPSCTGSPAAGRDLVFVVHANCGEPMDFTFRQLEADASMFIVTDCADISGSCVAGADAAGVGESETLHYVPSESATYYLILDADGADAGGMWTLDYSVWCVTPEACCLPDGRCIMDCVSRCLAMEGIPMGGGVTCVPNPCEADPVVPLSWGRVRAAFR